MSDDEAIKTAFHEVTRAMGGTHVAEGGWYWLEGFGDTAREYAAVRDDVAVWDVSPLNKWDFRGPDALRAAQYVFSNDVEGLDVGQARYGAFLDGDGMMVDDGTVFNTRGPDHCWVMTNGKDLQGYFADSLKGFDVEVEWIAPRMPHLGVIGPRSRQAVQAMTDADLSSLRYFRFLPEPVRVADVEVILSRTGFGGELGYELFLTDPQDAEALWNVVVDAGITPFGATAIEILRIEAGLIVTDYDYEPHQRSPYDFGLDRLVALDSPAEFVGKDRLREIAADPPNRFVTLKVDGDVLPDYGASVSSDGQEVGVLTSPTDSPRFGKIGLALVRSGFATPGTTLEVSVEGWTAPATVDVLPIYDTNKTRPRA